MMHKMRTFMLEGQANKATVCFNRLSLSLKIPAPVSCPAKYSNMHLDVAVSVTTLFLLGLPTAPRTSACTCLHSPAEAFRV